MTTQDSGERDAQPMFLTIDDLCRELQVSRSTIYKWKRAGHFPRARRNPSGRIIVHRDWLREWVEQLPDTTG